MKRIIIIILISLFCFLTIRVERVLALPVGTLLYRTSSNGNLYGLNQKELMTSKNAILDHVYTGHSAIYVGKIKGKHYIVEALSDGIQKTEAKYFLDESKGEKFLGAKIPKNSTKLQRQMAAKLALSLSEYHFSYDFDFKYQKGPKDAQWTCVGLTEKLYESSNISNPYDFSALVYNTDNYGVDITTDGYDDYSTYNERGDCFSRTKEFSKINPYYKTLIPAPEILGYNVGRQYQGDRYFFFPYTQFLQDSLETVDLDIDISDTKSDDYRPGYKKLSLALKMTFVNQPLSIITKVRDYIKKQKAVAYLAEDSNKEALLALKNNKEEEDKDNDDTLNLIGSGKEEREVLLKDDLKIENDYSDQINLNINSENNNGDKDSLKSDEIERIVEGEEYKVAKILESDTILLENGSQITFAGISLPKKGNKIRNLNECKALDVYNFSKELLDSTTVKLYFNKHLEYDNNNRLLAYVYVKKNNSFVFANLEFVKKGLASIYDCDSFLYCNDDFSKQLKEEFNLAKENKIGIHSDECLETKNKEDNFSDLAINLFNGIKSGGNKIINSLGQIVRKPGKSSANDNENNIDIDKNYDNKEDDNNSLDYNLDDDEEFNIGENNDNNDDIDNNENNDSNEEDYNYCIDKLLISALYTTSQDDWIEIYNNCDRDIDLAKENIRLEKAKSLENPNIIIRFNESSDYSSDDTIIEAYSSYTISRVEANLEFSPQALSLRGAFALADSGYSIYLAKGPVSDSYDEDIIDMLGFGSDSLYYQGSSPAKAIDDYYILRRKADINSNVLNLYPYHNYGQGSIYNSGHNFQDFILLETSLVPEDDENNDQDDNENNNGNNSDDEDDNNNDIDTGEEDDSDIGDEGDDNDDEGDNASDDEDDNNDDEEEGEEPNECVDSLLISALYSTFEDDWIEIYNNCDRDVDLAKENIRLEKSVSTESPAILLRFSEVDDYISDDVIIEPYTSYIISRDEANLSFSPQAVSVRDEFTWSNSGYSIYLAKGPVSDPYDEDIIDMLGFGSDSLYYQGVTPAFAVGDYQLLRRKANLNSDYSNLDLYHNYIQGEIYNTFNNHDDFTLLDASSDLGEGAGSDTGGNGIEEIPNDLSSLWHLDSCKGDSIYDSLNEKNSSHSWQWAVGENSCALRANYSDDPLVLPLEDNIDANNFSVSFKYRFEETNGRIKLKYVNQSDENVIITLSPAFIEITLPREGKIRYTNFSLPIDTNWHDLAISINLMNFSLDIYLDDQILANFPLNQLLYDFSSVQLISDNAYSIFDEIAIFSRAEDLDFFTDLNYPLEPYIAPNFIGTLDLKHAWNFNQGQGSVAYDSVGFSNLNINSALWCLGAEEAKNDFGVKFMGGDSMSTDININDIRKSFSFGFWYKNSSYSNESRGRLFLKKESEVVLGLKFTYYRPYLYFNNQEIRLFPEGAYISHDDNWHYLALAYDASNYSLNFFVDGQKVYNQDFVWADKTPDLMEIVNENYNFQVDEMKIYEGALDFQEVNYNYQQKNP